MGSKRKMNSVTEAVALRINGSVLAVGQRPNLDELEGALRGIALSDSPVLINGSTPDCSHLLDRLHNLGRRSGLPVHSCHSPEEAEELFTALMDSKTAKLGTWALHGVGGWPRELQMALNRILEALDQSRLHGRLRHESIPRVVVLESSQDSETASLEPDLQRRLSYFHLAAVPQDKKAN